jgi:single-strand DNA-binding protein
VNSVSIIGRLTRDPELRHTPSGMSVCGFSLAVDRAGQGKDESGFFDVTVWGDQGENCAQYLIKGQQAAVNGRLQFRKWEAKDGTTRTAIEIVANHVTFLAKPGERDGQQVLEPVARTRQAPSASEFDDDIPFAPTL